MKIFIGAHPDFASTPRNEFRNFYFNYLSIQDIFFIRDVIGNIDISPCSNTLMEIPKTTFKKEEILFVIDKCAERI